MSDSALGRDVIDEVGHDGTNLTHSDTFKDVSNLWQPSMSTWDTYDLWKKKSGLDISERTTLKWQEALNNCPQSLIDAELDRELTQFIASFEDAGIEL